MNTPFISFYSRGSIQVARLFFLLANVSALLPVSAWAVSNTAAAPISDTRPSPSADSKEITKAAIDKHEKSVSKFETYQDLIEKAQNLTLQRDRLQASQVLIRGIQKESKNSLAYKELTKALDSLATLFYTEKAHGLFSSAEAIADTKPKEASETYTEALRLEDSNLSLLKGLARAQLILGECGKADATVLQAEGVNPFSAEVRLLRFQVSNCEKNFGLLASQITAASGEQEQVQKFQRGLECAVAMQTAQQMTPPDFKKVKALLVSWENKDPEYPELYVWKWRYLQALAAADEAELVVKSVPFPSATSRTAALRYVQLCQSLTPRKRKNFSLDVELCRSLDDVELFLKSSGQTPAPNVPPPALPAKGITK